MRFHATLELGGKTATGIQVPEEVVSALGPQKQPPVRVTICDHTYRTTVARRGERFLISVSAANREKAGVAAGDEIDVDIELDTEPREVSIPPDFARELEKDAEAKSSFEGLSYSHKLRHVLAIEEAKKPETRQRRIEKAIVMLREGRP